MKAAPTKKSVTSTNTRKTGRIALALFLLAILFLLFFPFDGRPTKWQVDQTRATRIFSLIAHYHLKTGKTPFTDRPLLPQFEEQQLDAPERFLPRDGEGNFIDSDKRPFEIVIRGNQVTITGRRENVRFEHLLPSEP